MSSSHLNRSRTSGRCTSAGLAQIPPPARVWARGLPQGPAAPTSPCRPASGLRVLEWGQSGVCGAPGNHQRHSEHQEGAIPFSGTGAHERNRRNRSPRTISHPVECRGDHGVDHHIHTEVRGAQTSSGPVRDPGGLTSDGWATVDAHHEREGAQSQPIAYCLLSSLCPRHRPSQPRHPARAGCLVPIGSGVSVLDISRTPNQGAGPRPTTPPALRAPHPSWMVRGSCV